MTTRRGDGIDSCKFCGAEHLSDGYPALFSSFFDADGYSTDGNDGSAYDTVCQSCGKFQDRRNTARSAGARMLLKKETA